MSNSLSNIRTIEEQQLTLIKDTASKEMMEEQLIEKDIARGDKEIISSLREIFHILQEQFDFDRDTENKRKLSEHVQKDYQVDTASKVDMGGVEGLLKKLIETTENISSSSGGGLGGAIVGGLSAFMAGRFITLLAGAIGIAGVMKLLTKMDTSLLGTTEAIIDMGKSLMNMLPSFGGGGSSRPMSQEEFARERIPKQLGGESARKSGDFTKQPMTSDTFDQERIPKVKEKLNIKGSGVAKYLQETDASNLQKSMGISKEKYDVFRGSIAKIESPSYSKKGGSSGRFSGAYQMGAAEIRDSAKALGISAPTREEFLNNPQLQEKLFDKYTESHHKQLMKNQKYASMSKEEQLKVLGYAHNQGAGGASKWLKTGVAGKDAFGTAGTKYYESIGKNLSALEKGDLKIDYSDKQNPVKTVKEERTSTVSKETPSTSKLDTDQLQKAKETLSSRLSHKGVDVKNLNAEYASNLSNFISDTEKEFGKKMKITSAFRPPTGKEKEQLNSVGSTQGGLKKGKMVGSTYGSMHGMGIASDVMFEGMGMEEMNKMSSSDKEKWLNLAQKHNLDVPMRPGGTAPSLTEWWHLEPKGAERGGAKKRGLEGKEYVDYIKNASLEEKLKSDNSTYAKLEKQLPEGGKYKEEESEMEEMDEPILEEKTKSDLIEEKASRSKSDLIEEKASRSKSDLIEEKTKSDTQVDSGYKNFFEDMVNHLEKMVTFTEEIKKSNKEMADSGTEKQSDTAKKEDLNEEKPTASKESENVKDNLLKEEPSYSFDQSSKGANLRTEKENLLSNFGINPFSNIPQSIPGTGIFGKQPAGGFGQNPFGTIQNVLGGIGSAVSTGQQIGNIGKYGMGGGMFGGIGAAQGAIGGIQGVMGQMGQQSPMLGGLGQVLGSVGSVAGSIQGMKNMGGAGGILGGINAASGVIGAAGNIFNAGKGILGGMGGLFGGESSEKTGNMINDNPMLKGMADNVGDFFGIRSVGKERTDDLSDPSKWHPIESKGIGDDAAAVKAKNEPEGDSNFFNDRIREVYGENKGLSNNNKSSASLMPSVSTDGFSLEGMSKDVEAGKEEMMMPTGGGEPVVVNAGGGGGGSGGGGGGGSGSQDNPSSTGVMGIDIGVRNEEATLMRAQFGSVRIV